MTVLWQLAYRLGYEDALVQHTGSRNIGKAVQWLRRANGLGPKAVHIQIFKALSVAS